MTFLKEINFNLLKQKRRKRKTLKKQSFVDRRSNANEISGLQNSIYNSQNYQDK